MFGAINKTATGINRTADDTREPRCDKHKFGVWSDPFMMDTLIQVMTSEYRPVSKLYQTRQCLECGEAQVRRIN